MNITCTQLDDLLFDGSALAMETAARHAAECEACAQKLAEWNEIGDTAKSLHETWQSDLLWPRIERSLRSEKQRKPVRRIWQYAAAVLLTLGLGGTMWFSLREQNRDAAFDTRILRVEALDEVDRLESPRQPQ